MKQILDACCGSRMFWFDKKNPHVEFCDSKGCGTSSTAPPEQQGMFEGSRAVADSDIPF